MAADFGYDSCSEAAYNETDEVELSFEGATSEDGHKFRPGLADDLKVGFFSLDRTTQTEESEIIHLKDMTLVIQELLKDAAEMKRDINFARHVMNADFETKLKQKSIDLYCRSNERIVALEKIHEERTATVRRAFKQQLSDAIAHMHSYYLKDMEARLGKDAMAKHGESAKWESKFGEMTATIQRNESIIHMLKAQIEQYQRHAEDAERATQAALIAAETVEIEQADIKSQHSRSDSVMAEVEGLRDEIHFLEQKCARLEDTLQERERSGQNMNGEIQGLLEQLEMERILVQQLQHEKEEMLSDSQNDKEFGARMIESQRLAMEKEMGEKIRLATEKALMDGKEEAAKLQGAEQNKYARLQEEKLALEARLAKAMSKAGEKTRETIDLEKAKRNESRLMLEITWLKKEIEKVHKTWEKKFTILQQSLHALKDESYLRQTLQRQAAQLHQAAISYAYDGPMGISSNRPPPPAPSKHPLPDIRGGKGRKSPDAISYTVSAVSGRNTAVFTQFDEIRPECKSLSEDIGDNDKTVVSMEMDCVDPPIPPPTYPHPGIDLCNSEVEFWAIELENQVMSDGEQELPPEFVPLPCPPSRSQQDCGDESRPSTRSHVVVLPSAEVQ